MLYNVQCSRVGNAFGIEEQRSVYVNIYQGPSHNDYL